MNNYKYLHSYLVLVLLAFGSWGCSLSEDMDTNKANNAGWGLREPKIMRLEEAQIEKQSLSFRKAHALWDHYRWSDTLIFSKSDVGSGNLIIFTTAECSAENSPLAPYTTRRNLTKSLPLYKLISLETIQLLDQAASAVSCRFLFRAENQNGGVHTFELERRMFTTGKHLEPTQIRRIRDLSAKTKTTPNTIEFESLPFTYVIFSNPHTNAVQMLCKNHLSPVVTRSDTQNLAQLFGSSMPASRTLKDEKCRLLGYAANGALAEMSEEFFIRNPFPFPKLTYAENHSALAGLTDRIQVPIGPFSIENTSDENFLLEVLGPEQMNLTAEFVLYNVNNGQRYAQKVPMKLNLLRSLRGRPTVMKSNSADNGSFMIPIHAGLTTKFSIRAEIREARCDAPYLLEGVHISGGEIENSLPYNLHLRSDSFETEIVAAGHLAENINVWASIKNMKSTAKKPAVKVKYGPRKIMGEVFKKCRFI